MIHFIHGTLADIKSDFAVIDCGGVGFKLGISVATGAKISQKVGKDILLYTYMAVSEDNISLYGFAEEDELELFTKLISVSGIGPKAATAILGTLSPDALRSAIANNDAKTISTAPGVGLKTAQKLIIELKDKITGTSAELPASAPKDNEKLTQVVDTLAVYGFPRGTVIDVLKRLDSSLPLEELIAQTLRILGKESGR
ncbi:MAG: Holliday junction branch migration protein RuvA [Ruminococcaceae bacterium]|nr:Holliday junction branch migration protein RuvA [Oscillospiraceae bacterium]